MNNTQSTSIAHCKPRQSESSSAALGIAFIALFFAAFLIAAAPAPDSPVNYSQPRQIGELQNKSLNEASGLACSRRDPSLWWTHNDSGDGPFIYALGPKGEDRGRIELDKVTAIDCEDICSFTLDGKPYLLFADFGDNNRKRGSYSLYIFPEPDAPGANQSVTISHFHTMRFQYTPDGQSYNCEAVAFDPPTRSIILITKRWFINDDVPTRVFRMPLPADLTQPTAPLVTAEQIAQFDDMQMVTAMDISPDGSRAIVMTMFQHYEYSKTPHKPDETWADAFARKPRTLPRPPLKQGEAVAFAPDGLSIRFTSEQRPAPFYEIVPQQNN